MAKNRPLAIFERFYPNPAYGLTGEQVAQRLAAGAVNAQPQGLTPSVPRIVLKNSLNLFNFINLVLAIAVIWVGQPSQTLFFGVVICNTAMGIYQELRAKKTLDKLSVVAQSRVSVLRDGKKQMIPQDEVVLDDIITLAAGDQICADATVLEAHGLEIDESLLTGEGDKIHKIPGETVLSGSYVTAGQAVVCAAAVGADNYANALTAQAKKKKKKKSRLMATLNLIIRVLTVLIIPLGILLFHANYNTRGETLQQSVLGATASMTGMIPGGLVLLTGVTMTVGAMNLAKRKALVQSLPSIETLARVDTLCLDKTGTITDGALVFEGIEPWGETPPAQVEAVIAQLMGALGDQNATAKCLRAQFGAAGNWPMAAAVPFSSDRKWSGVTFSNGGTWILGAPGILFGHQQALLQRANTYAAQGYRVLSLAHSPQPLQGEMLPGGLACAALLLLSDSIREDAVSTFRFFAEEGVTLKVISGDNPKTVSAVALKAQIAGGERAIDMSTLREDADFGALAEEYVVFGHVMPQQKQKLIRAMRQNGHTVCMTGDGVNDILAMREADCSVAMAGGSSAARSACDFVLMSPTFGAMRGVLREGRRVINNIERVACLYLVNTLFSMLLCLLYILLPLPYPYDPRQMTPINAFTVGIPSFFLALQPNYARPQGKLFTNIFEHSLPAALTIVFNTLYLQAAALLFELPKEEFSTMVVFMAGVVGFMLLLRIARPYTRAVKIMLAILITGFLLLFIFFGDLFLLESIFSRNVFFYLPLIYFSFHIHGFLGRICHRGVEAIAARRRPEEFDDE